MTSTAFSSTRVRVTSFRSQEQKLKRYSFIWLTALTRSTPLTKPLKLWTHGRLWYWINQVKELTTCTVLHIWSGLNICITFDQLFTINFLFSSSNQQIRKLGMCSYSLLTFCQPSSPSFSHLPPLPQNTSTSSLMTFVWPASRWSHQSHRISLNTDPSSQWPRRSWRNEDSEDFHLRPDLTLDCAALPPDWTSQPWFMARRYHATRPTPISTPHIPYGWETKETLMRCYFA